MGCGGAGPHAAMAAALRLFQTMLVRGGSCRVHPDRVIWGPAVPGPFMSRALSYGAADTGLLNKALPN